MSNYNVNNYVKRVILDSVISKVNLLSYQTPEEEIMDLIFNVIAQEVGKVSSSKAQESKLRKIVELEVFSNIAMAFPIDPEIGLFLARPSLDVIMEERTQ